jgi:hypothetical protein
MEAEDPYFTAAALFPEHDWHTVDDKPGPLICEPREHIVRCYSCRHWLRVLGLLACTARQEGYDSGKADGIREGLERAARLADESAAKHKAAVDSRPDIEQFDLYAMCAGGELAANALAVKFRALREAQGEQPPQPKGE